MMSISDRKFFENFGLGLNSRRLPAEDGGKFNKLTGVLQFGNWVVRTKSQKRFDGRTFSALFFVNLFVLTVVQSLLEGKSLIDGLWLFLKLLPWGILMVFLVSLGLDKSLLFEDDEEEGGIGSSGITINPEE